MKASDYVKTFIRASEGYSAKAYLCPAGIPTIGWGHTKGVKMGQTCTLDKAQKYLEEDIAPIEKYLNTIPQLNTQGKFDACIDFCFNLGIAKFKGSTLLRYIKAGRSNDEICVQFNRWVWGTVGGKHVKLNGLVKRRSKECSMWRTI